MNNTDNPANTDRKFDIFELTRIILVNRIGIIILVAVVGVIAVIYSLLTPQIWRSDASFHVMGNSVSGLPISLSGISGLASDLIGMDDNTEALNSIAVLQSRTINEELIRRFKMVEYFELADKDSLANMDDALRLMEEVVEFGFGDKTGLVSIQAETKSKELSRDIVSFYLDKLDTYNRQQKFTKGKRNRIFLEARVRELRHDIDSLLVANREFQTIHQAIDLAGQSQALITSYSNVIAEKMKLEIQLELARLNYSPNSPVVKDLETQTAALARQIADLETNDSKLKPKYLINISSIPSLTEQLAQLQLNLETAQRVFEYVYPQYEAARLEELHDMPSIQMLDSPRKAGRRVRPRRALICVVAVFVAFCMGTLMAVIKEIVMSSKDRIAMLKDTIRTTHDPEV